jgi:hypothetical protein
LANFKRNKLAITDGDQTKGVTVQQYAMAWDMYFTGHTIQAIQTSVGLSRTQMEWLVKVGDPKKGMASFASRAGEISAEVKKRQAQIVDIVSEGAVEWVKARKDLALNSTKMISSLQSALAMLLGRSITNINNGEATELDYERLKASAPIREAIKALTPVSTFAPITDVMNSLAGQSMAVANKNLPLAAESSLPANVAMIENVLGPAEVSHDPLADLIPGWDKMTEDERKAYLAQGKQNSRSLPIIDASIVKESK